MTELDELQKKIRAIADTVNSFKSEAVQLRVVEILLGQIGVSDITPSGEKKARRPSRSMRGSRRETVKDPSPDGSTKKAKPKASRTSTSPGSFAMISQLLSDGFFKSPRTIASIVEHCSTSRGHHYKASECSPVLLRLLRDGKLKRNKNKEGQYEYSQA